jgi:predicted RNA-binding protein YlxR (DUF448 family)
MLRIAARGQTMILDLEGGVPGRGGYLHPDGGCLEKFAASKIKEFRSLKRSVDRSERLRITEEIKRWLASERRLEYNNKDGPKAD